MNIPDHIFESLETIFWVKILKLFDADPESFQTWIWDEKKHWVPVLGTLSKYNIP